MKDFFRFAFSFLYTRNWHTGQKELSHSRLVILACTASFVVIAVVLISFLQAPIEVMAISN
jgi:hypothetical protein